DSFHVRGPLAIGGGHLYACEDRGWNTEGLLLDVTLADVPIATEYVLAFKEFSVGAVATDKRVFSAIVASAGSGIESDRPLPAIDTIIDSSIPHGEAWTEEGPPQVALTSLPAKSRLTGIFLDDGEIVMVQEGLALRFDESGQVKSTFQLSPKEGFYSVIVPHA